MKLLTTIAAVLISVYSINLCASERINLPIKSHSFVFEGDVHSKVKFENHLDSTENKGNIRIVLGVVETLGGCGILYAGIAGLGAGMVVHLFRPEDRREWIALYSLGTTGTALGLFLIDNGMKRIGFKGLFTSKPLAQPGIYY